MKKFLTRLLVPLLITVLILFLFFRDISLKDIKENFLKIPLFTLLAFVLLSLLGTLLRAIKYHILLSRKLSFKDIFFITLVRNFAVDLLPARSAALIFYTYLARKKGLSVEEGASSFVVSVFYDGLALSFMLGGLVFFLKTGINKTAVYAGISMIFLASVGMIFLSDRVIGILLGFRIIKRFKKIEKPLTNIYTYLLGHKKNSERVTVFLLSFLIRIIKYVFIFILFQGVVQVGWGTRIFSVFSFSLAITELSSLLPIQGLGGFGTWELAFAASFGAMFTDYAISRSILQSAGFVIHITTQVWEYFIGMLAFFYLQVKSRKNSRKNPPLQSIESDIQGSS